MIGGRRPSSLVSLQTPRPTALFICRGFFVIYVHVFAHSNFGPIPCRVARRTPLVEAELKEEKPYPSVLNIPGKHNAMLAMYGLDSGTVIPPLFEWGMWAEFPAHGLLAKALEVPVNIQVVALGDSADLAGIYSGEVAEGFPVTVDNEAPAAGAINVFFSFTQGGLAHFDVLYFGTGTGRLEFSFQK